MTNLWTRLDRMRGRRQRDVVVPTQLPVLIDPGNGQAMFDAHDMTRALRLWAEFFRNHPGVSVTDVLHEAADDIDVAVLVVEEKWREGTAGGS